jgi:hypothetical protein
MELKMVILLGNILKYIRGVAIGLIVIPLEGGCVVVVQKKINL